MRVGWGTTLWEPPEAGCIVTDRDAGIKKEAHLQLQIDGPGTFPPAAPLSARAQVAIPQVTGPAAPVKTQVAGSAEPRSRPGTGRRWRSTRPARLRARHHPQEQGPGLPPAPWASILESVRGPRALAQLSLGIARGTIT